MKITPTLITAALVLASLPLSPCARAQETNPTEDRGGVEPEKNRFSEILKLVQGLNEDLQQQERECREMQAKHKAQADEMDRQREDQKLQLEAAAAERDEAQNRLAETQATVKEEMSALVKKHGDEKAAAAVEIEQARSAMDKLKAENEELRRSADEGAVKLQESDTVVAEMRTNGETMKQQLADAAQKQASDSATIAQLEKELAEQRTNTEKTEVAPDENEPRRTKTVPAEEAEALTAQLKESENAASTLTQERDALITRLEESAVRIAGAEGKIVSLTTRVEEQTSATEIARAAARELEDKLSTEPARLQQANEALGAELQAAGRRFEDATAAMNQLKEEMASQQRRSDETTTAIRATLEQQTKIDADRAAAIQQLEKQNAESSARRELFEAELAGARESLRSIREEFEKARAPKASSPESGIQPVFYEAGSEDNDAEFDRVLKDAQRVIGKFPEAKFTVVGHATEEGAFEANLHLGARRAEKVGLFLMNNGIQPDHITLTATGASRSQADKNTSERSPDRCVEILVETAGN